jgi:hypothetical protein
VVFLLFSITTAPLLNVLAAKPATALAGTTYTPLSLDSGWTPHRTAPSGGYGEETFAGRSTLEVGVDNLLASDAPGYYRTEGVKYATEASDTIMVDLYIDDGWVEEDIDVRAGLGGNATDEESTIEYVRTDAYTGWRMWDTVDEDWVNLTAPAVSGDWVTLEIALSKDDATKIDIYIDGLFAGQSMAESSGYFDVVVLSSFNYATTAEKNYEVHWSNPASGVYNPDTTDPVVSIKSPTGGYVDGIVTVSGTVTDENPDHYNFVVLDGDGTIVAGPGVVHAASVADWVWDTTDLPDGGLYTIILEAWDTADNRSMVASKAVTIDKTAPTIMFDSASESFVTAGDAVAFFGTVDDMGATLELFVDDTSIGDIANNGGSWAFEIANGFTKGSHVIEVVATDWAGRTSKARRLVQAAVVTIDKPQNQPVETLEPQPLLNTTRLFASDSYGWGGKTAGGLETSPVVSDSKNETDDVDRSNEAPVAPSDSGWKIVGVLWYWWVFLAMAIGGAARWWVARRRI